MHMTLFRSSTTLDYYTVNQILGLGARCIVSHKWLHTLTTVSSFQNYLFSQAPCQPIRDDNHIFNPTDW